MRVAPVVAVAILLAAPLAAALPRHAGYGAAQPDPLAVLAPVQTVVDAAPDIARLTVTEADRDGTSDEGLRLAAEIHAFVDGFRDPVLVPAGATGGGLSDALLLATADLADLLAGIPEAAGPLATLREACLAEGETATLQRYRDWVAEQAHFRSTLEASKAGLRAWMIAPPAAVDVVPLQTAVSVLDAWHAPAAQATTLCLDRVQERLAVEDLPLLMLQLRPATTWPGGSFRAIGSVTGVASDAALEVEVVGIQPAVPVAWRSDGSFSREFRLPLDAPLGNHSVVARIASLVASANLTIEHAPTRIVLTYPPRVVVNSTFRITAHVLGPPGYAADVGPGPLTAAGFLSEPIPLAQAVGTVDARAPESPRDLEGTIRYPGTATLSPSEAPYRIRVVVPATNATLNRDDPARSGLLRPFVNTWIVPMLVGALFLVLLIGALAFARQRRRIGGVDPVSVALADGSLRSAAEGRPAWTAAPGLVGVFVAFWRWLLARGRIQRSTTAREAVAAIGVEAGSVVAAFERSRYGDLPERPGDEAAAQRLADAARAHAKGDT